MILGSPDWDNKCLSRSTRYAGRIGHRGCKSAKSGTAVGLKFPDPFGGHLRDKRQFGQRRSLADFGLRGYFVPENVVPEVRVELTRVTDTGFKSGANRID